MTGIDVRYIATLRARQGAAEVYMLYREKPYIAVDEVGQILQLNRLGVRQCDILLDWLGLVVFRRPKKRRVYRIESPTPPFDATRIIERANGTHKRKSYDAMRAKLIDLVTTFKDLPGADNGEPETVHDMLLRYGVRGDLLEKHAKNEVVREIVANMDAFADDWRSRHNENEHPFDPAIAIATALKRGITSPAKQDSTPIDPKIIKMKEASRAALARFQKELQ